MEHKEVWEGNTSAYATILREADNEYRMYYRGWHMKPGPRASKPAHEAVFCLALSEDGINWRKPNLGLIEYAGSKDNNIVWAGEGADAFVPMLDNNPDAAANAKYKAVANAKDKRGRRFDGFSIGGWPELGEDA